MSPDFHPLRAIDALPHLVWVAGPDGAVEYVSRRAVEYTGVPADDHLGWDWRWLVHPDDLPPTLARWNAAVARGGAYEVEHRFRRADGQYRWFLVRAESVRDGDGRVARWVGTSTDVDDLRRDRADAREERRVVRAFADRGPDGRALVGGDGVVVYANPALARLLGAQRDAVVGTDARDRVHRDDRPRVAAAVDDLLARPGGRVEGAARLRHADGTYRRVRVSAANLLPDPDVRAVAVTVTADAGG